MKLRTDESFGRGVESCAAARSDCCSDAAKFGSFCSGRKISGGSEQARAQQDARRRGAGCR